MNAQLLANRSSRIANFIDGALQVCSGYAESAHPVLHLVWAMQAYLGAIRLLLLSETVHGWSSFDGNFLLARAFLVNSDEPSTATLECWVSNYAESRQLLGSPWESN
jgi:hypothetical protein